MAFVLLAGCSASSSEVRSPAPASRDASLYYFESVPNEPLTLRLSSPACLRRFDGVKTVVDGTVRGVHVYIDGVTCPNPTSEYVVEAAPSRMTHVYITASGGIRLR